MCRRPLNTHSLYTDAIITEASGYVGTFVTKVRSGPRVAEISHGATVIATGADEYKPTEFLYGEDERVMTQLELEEKITSGGPAVADSQSVVMIRCVGCRQEDRNYCARICCSHAIKNALKLKSINPENDVHILFRDMRTYGFKEDFYREAAEKDVKFIRYGSQRMAFSSSSEKPESGVIGVPPCEHSLSNPSECSKRTGIEAFGDI
jgi:heterodisulfide reductase subunit A2